MVFVVCYGVTVRCLCVCSLSLCPYRLPYEPCILPYDIVQNQLSLWCSFSYQMKITENFLSMGEWARGRKENVWSIFRSLQIYLCSVSELRSPFCVYLTQFDGFYGQFSGNWKHIMNTRHHVWLDIGFSFCLFVDRHLNGELCAIDFVKSPENKTS